MSDAFDVEDWTRRVFARNPWLEAAHGALSADSEAFGRVKARPKWEHISHLTQEGRWDDWLRKMRALRREVDEATLTPYWRNHCREVWENAVAVDFEGETVSEHLHRGREFPGVVVFKNARFVEKVDFEDCVFHGHADFGGAVFEKSASFSGAEFRAEARFVGAKFHAPARFSRVRFSGAAAWFHDGSFDEGARFHGAAFDGDARFERAVFGGVARFERAQFAKSARFSEVRFLQRAAFNQSEFRGHSSFEAATFGGLASFFAATGKAGAPIDMAGATFARVPDFDQADFPQAPRLDNVDVSEGADDRRDPKLAAKWRNLKRLAIQAHDHEREMDFFAGEMKALRRIDYAKRGYRLKSAMSLLYQWTSDFGRSVFRPILWWIALILLFASINYGAHVASIARTDGGPPRPSVDCVVGSSDPVSAALNLSWTKALVVGGLGGASLRTAQDYACLFGIHGRETPPEALPEQFTPVIPGYVAFLGSVQLLLSTGLIFLFLLALRNQFRIR